MCTCNVVHVVNVNVSVNKLRAIPEQDFDDSGEPGSQAQAVKHLQTPLTTARNSQALSFGLVTLQQPHKQASTPCISLRGGPCRAPNRALDVGLKQEHAPLTVPLQPVRIYIYMYACMYVCMYDYIAVSTRTLTPPTTET